MGLLNVIVVDEKIDSFRKYLSCVHNRASFVLLYQAPSSELNLTLLALFVSQLAYFSMFFSLPLACSKINSIVYNQAFLELELAR